MTFDEIIKKKKIEGYSKERYREIRNAWDRVAKPLDSMGKFEPLLAQVGAIQDTLHPRLEKAVLPVFAADNGIVFQGVSQSGQEVTAICARNIIKDRTSVCVMARSTGVRVELVDVGVNGFLFGEEDGLPDKTVPCREAVNVFRRKKIRMGTGDFSVEPAMTEAEAKKAMETGFLLAKEYKKNGVDILGVGEIGIGNTTTSSAVATALLRCPAAEVTGRGAGLSDEGLNRKVRVIEEAIKKYDLWEKDPFTILCCVGGFDIAAMTGFYIGAAAFKIPVVLDGMISLVAALLAERLVPGVKDFLLASHNSREPVAAKIVKELGLLPVVDADMALGEGTGSVLMIQLLKTAGAVYEECCPFTETGIEPYKRF